MNQKLSERRAEAFRRYLLKTYSRFAPSTVIAQGKGENWGGFRRLAVADPNLNRKAEVLSIIDNPNLTLSQREARLVTLDRGRIYKSYIYPEYYPKLRSGASLLVIYNAAMPTDIDKPVVKTVVEPKPEPEPVTVEIVKPEREPVTQYPILLRTNLLYDAIGAVNIGIEIPIKRHFSLITDFAYSYWRGSKNLYAFQTLEYGIEGRYWFGVSEARKTRSPEWAKPLRGWNVGVYSRYYQRYDVQWIDGVQGDDSWSAGITAGYAFPIARNLTFEPSLGAGYFSTSEYRHYHQPEYEAQGKYHLMWQQTGSWSGLSLTKVRFSLVWLIGRKKRGGIK